MDRPADFRYSVAWETDNSSGILTPKRKKELSTGILYRRDPAPGEQNHGIRDTYYQLQWRILLCQFLIISGDPKRAAPAGIAPTLSIFGAQPDIFGHNAEES